MQRKNRTRTRSELKRLAARTTAALFAALAEAGLDTDDMETVLREACSTAAKPRTVNGLGRGPDSAQLGTALALWHRDPRFTDPVTGSPLALHPGGRGKSLTTLLRAAGVTSKCDSWAKFMIRSGVLRLLGDGKFLPRGRSARMPALNEMQIDHVALGVYHLIRTATRNYTPQVAKRPMLQGAAIVRGFPKRQRESFRRFVNQQGDAFLSNVDDYLESRSTKTSTRKGATKESGRAGVYVFAFTE